MEKKIKTIDIQAKQWFDKINGNSYFSAIVTIDFGTEKQRQYKLPFQYGYGDHYVDMAAAELEKQNEISLEKCERLWQYCYKNEIILRKSKQENCLKKDVKAYGI